MNKYQVILTTVDSVIFEGRKSDCEKVIEAFKNYNDCKNIELHKSEGPAISEDLRESMLDSVYDMIYSSSLDDPGYAAEMRADLETADLTDEELIDLYETYFSCDDGEYAEQKHIDTYNEARAQLAIQEVLKDE